MKKFLGEILRILEIKSEKLNISMIKKNFLLLYKKSKKIHKILLKIISFLKNILHLFKINTLFQNKHPNIPNSKWNIINKLSRLFAKIGSYLKEHLLINLSKIKFKIFLMNINTNKSSN